MSYLLLSTYPQSGTKNSGDDLIGKSLAELIKYVKGSEVKIDFTSAVDNTPIEVENLTKYKAILAPALRPTLKGNSVAPKNRSMFLEEAYRNAIPIFAVGAGWKAYPGTLRQSHKLMLDKKDKEQLAKYFGEKNDSYGAHGAISCRDITTENLLKNNGINCYGTTGDCGLFDYNYIEKPFVLPKEIKNISISIPHNNHHKEMAYLLALKVKKEFSCDVYITFHGYKGSLEEEIKPHWNRNEVYFVDLSGGSEKLSFYSNIDAHIGFRLHAHIWFLRTRKPSLLLAEDGRGLGHLYTFNGLGYSAAPKLSLKTSNVFPKFTDSLMKILNRKNPSYDAIEMFKEEMQNGYPTTQKTLLEIDNLWKVKMKPFLELIP
ncbi:polysaccharide pyruvyl transferase [Melghiribacillus thermohalophilus]|uniref:Polysaccharide pyruvyl transferase n=1 Tax=Melghiribacillus thermohalophilus TaxID=1324956 RepID=A0A4R3NCH1_9BACI|nr:polysaccharide pyruvyl transferase family protein [Melghiribacillus thermohalophilus]TCT26461.1 polysaccharide pyruvyl transferase [Melghiribacillus thermohalophilus]